MSGTARVITQRTNPTSACPSSLRTLAFSFALSLYLYASSFVGDKVLAEHGNTGFSLYDFFIGRELNPRLFNNTFDLKEFCELRPGPKNTE